jgi:hypothetical protein
MNLFSQNEGFFIFKEIRIEWRNRYASLNGIRWHVVGAVSCLSIFRLM